jgi:hypothetical protein
MLLVREHSHVVDELLERRIVEHAIRHRTERLMFVRIEALDGSRLRRPCSSARITLEQPLSALPLHDHVGDRVRVLLVRVARFADPAF